MSCYPRWEIKMEGKASFAVGARWPRKLKDVWSFDDKAIR